MVTIETDKVFAEAQTEEEINNTRLLEITRHADNLIYTALPQIKQNKLSSISIALLDKKILGEILTTDEEALLQISRDANTWVTAIRTIENTAQANGTQLADIVWTVV